MNQEQTREQLIEEFTELRNAQMKRGTCTRTRNIYFDHLNETDILARARTDEELVAAIKRLKSV